MPTRIFSGFKNFLSSRYIWLFPAFALALTGWLLKQYFGQQGPTVLIRFEDASSLQPEKTVIRHRGVMIGTVKQVKLAKDNQDVLVYARLSKEAERFAVNGTVFSLVAPKVGLQGVSGIETIFDGVYISAHPGPPEGKTQLEFIGTVGKNVSLSL